MQRGGRLLCPLQLPDKEHSLPAVDALQESRLSLRARTRTRRHTHTPDARGKACVPPPGEREGAGRLSPGPPPDTPVCAAAALPPSTSRGPARKDRPALVKGLDFS